MQDEAEREPDETQAGAAEADATPSPAPGSLLDGDDDGADEFNDTGGDEPADDDDGEESTARTLSAPPESPDGYSLPEIDGHEWGDADHEAFKEFFQHAHAGGLSQEGVNSVGKYYLAKVEALRQRDATDAADLREVLAENVGEDVLASDLKAVRGYLRTLPDGLGDEIKNARTGSGKRLVNHPEFFNLLRNVARGKSGRSDAERAAEIKHIMRTDLKRYHAENLGEELSKIERKRGNDPTPAPSRQQLSAREREIERIRSSDINRYYREKLDDELLELKRRRAG